MIERQDPWPRRPQLLGVWTAQELEVALVRTAYGDAELESALQLVIDQGPGAFALLAAGLLTVQPDVDDLGGGLWAEIEWADIDDAVITGALRAEPGELAALRKAARVAADR
ncbi:hypothetical protein [Klenkia sp. PcliD-1-E]|uniref:hypothetical protein n=1 Tax=Klenkia sp. PcliD-1-E TaxID=2954492 RepID=UPI00209808F3|nr:hypothetical protein [Klenkia sp. PcliD-1-E]MCO7221772.1 hypothetical protein [Klenkia sp. PcliD-1-E]